MSRILHLDENCICPARTGNGVGDMGVVCAKPALNRADVYVRMHAGEGCAIAIAQQNQIIAWASEGVSEKMTYT